LPVKGRWNAIGDIAVHKPFEPVEREPFRR
jgi:hypothetical protein